MDNAKQFTYTKEENKDKEITLNVKVESARFVAVKEKIFNRLSQNVKLPGFRPGKAPKALMEAQISDRVYNETINALLPEITAEILNSEKLNPMNQVQYELVKMSDADGIEYKAKFINYPEITLPDFKKIKVKKDVKQISDKDVESEVEKILKFYNKSAAPQTAATEGTDTVEKKEEAKVEMTDAAVKKLGIGFESLKELQDQVKKELETMNERDSEAKWLQQILDEAVKNAKITPPQALIAQSVQSREQDYMKKLEELNLKQEDFLKMQNTSLEKLRKDWSDEAKRKFSEELLLLEIIKNEKLVVTDGDVKGEIEKVTDPKLKTELDTPEGRRYIVTVLLQQKAIEWLREQVQK